MENALQPYKAELLLKNKIIVQVKVAPKAPKCAFKGVMEDGTIKLAVNEVAEKGKANLAVCVFLAKIFETDKENVRILSGATSRSKLVEITKEK